MAASGTLSQEGLSRKSSFSKRGVLTLTGFGIKVRMQSGHLEIEDGIGPERRTVRLARIGHGPKRLVCISENGFVTLAALKWIADVGASFVMLNRTGKVLFVTGPNASSDVRLRRAQALGHSSGAALRIARELINQKLRDRNTSPGTSSLLLLVRTRFIATGLSWQRLTRSTVCDWLNPVGLPPTGRRGELCQSIFREKISLECLHTGASSALAFRLLQVLPDLQ